jgi:hydrogenase assembly chaperone HypC/HupF
MNHGGSMCLATPVELKRIDGEWGFVEHDGHEHKISLSLIDRPKVGNWILAHGDLAVSRIEANEAARILSLIAESGHTHAHTH